MRLSIGNKLVNTGRQKEFDYQKTFIIIVMIITHIFEELSGHEVMSLADDPVQLALMYLSNTIAAPSFMFAMGMAMNYSRKKSPELLIDRGVRLLVWGYILNILRGTLVELAEYLTFPLLGAERPDFVISMYELLNVDIFHFAGLTFIVFGIFQKLKISEPYMLLIAFLSQGIGTLLVELPINNEMLQYFIGLFIYENEGTCFPLTLWLIYPVAGCCFGQILQYVHDKKLFYKHLLIVDASLLFSYTASAHKSNVNILTFLSLYDDLGYRHNTFGAVWTLINVLLVISLSYFVSEALANTKADTITRFFADKLNVIYIIQWIIIGWLYYPRDLLAPDLYMTYPTIVIVGLVVWAISSLLAKAVKKSPLS